MTPRKSRIMLVEDNVDETVLYKGELERDGDYEVLVAYDGEMALRLFSEQGPFDLVILDSMMPGMDSIEVLHRLLIDRHIRIIIYSGDLSLYRADFRTWPADAYIIKSSDLSELKQTIRRLLEK